MPCEVKNSRPLRAAGLLVGASARALEPETIASARAPSERQSCDQIVYVRTCCIDPLIPSTIRDSIRFGHSRRLNVFRTKSHADHTGRDAPQDRKASQQAQRQGEPQLLSAGQDAADDTVLHKDL